MTDIIRNEVKNNKLHIEHKDIPQQLKKDNIPTSLEEIKRAEKARRNAHTTGADMKREISMDIKNKLSESFEFIEESCGSGAPEFEFFDAPKEQVVTEELGDEVVTVAKYPIIGKASGVFAPIGVMSRNNRIYDEDHYDYLLSNQQLVDRITHRGMLGTIGHHDKKVDDQDLADGKVSHIVSDLHIKEEADGTRNLCGTLEILDTPAGHLLKTYYDSGIPLFVSSRGGGNLLPVPHESYKRVDKTKYFLETFDIVKNPGFLQAKPVYEKVTESVEATEEIQEIKEEKEETVDKIDKLTDVLTNFVNAITESKKEEKAEDNETKETKETKEAKEKSEAKEAKETKIEEAEEDKKEDLKIGKDEEGKDKDEKTPEDEKKEEAEDAVADTVSEDKKEDETIEKEAKKIVDPHKGLGKKDIANGRVQINLFNLGQARQMSKDGLENVKRIEADRKAHAEAHPHKEQPKKEEVAKQLRLGLKEESEYDKNMKIANDYDKLMMKQPAQSPDGSKNSVANYYQTKYQEYFDKAMQARHAEQAKGKKENIKEEVEAQPIAPVQNGEEYKNAQKAENKPVQPTTYDHQDLARALKANYKDTKGENK